ncbi:MAG: maleylacetoacetate isomerase [Alphaproteobacteria bacterium]|nr:maleylacetoacetate isomerase [Alphaproteobacteria bacterium]|tara:strand:- start:1212 stop:1889 length:678 start_codon:yes stop_codon:yes gene_type:complete
MIKLYDYYRASSAYRVRLALNIKDIAYESIHVDLLKGEHHGAKYKAINPLGTVPYFIDGDVELNQSLAIAQYLDNAYPDTKLVYGDAATQAHIWQLALLVATDIHPFGTPQVWKKYLMGILDASQEEANAWISHWLTRGLSTYEAMVSRSNIKGDYSCGDAISLADICLLPQLYNAHRYKIDLTPYKNLCCIEQNMLQQNAVQKSTPEAHAEAPQELENIHGNML